MNSSTENSKLRKDNCISSNIRDDSLMYLLSSPLPPLDAPASSSSPCFHLPLSFEDPFDDPSMEPMPLRSQSQVAPLVQSMSDSISMQEDCLDSSSMELNDSIRQDLIYLLDPAMNFVGSKRRSDDLFSNHGPPKRQRTSPMQAAALDEEETVARFRPYQEKQWREQFTKLVQYKLENGHCCVPHAYPEDSILARWVKRQRYQYKKMKDNNPTSTMTTGRIQELESIGFVWHSHSAAWQEKLNELKAFKQSTGHCNVPSNYPENLALSTWVKCQRRQFKLFSSGSSSTLTIERLQMLESLGFTFDMSKKATAIVTTQRKGSRQQ